MKKLNTVIMKTSTTSIAAFGKTVFNALLLLLFTGGLMAQTVTSVTPTRVSTKTKVTVIGTGLTGATVSLSDFSIGSVSVNGDGTQLTFMVGRTNTYVNASSDIVRMLKINGNDVTNLTYVAPTNKHLNQSSPNRVAEVYTTWDYANSGISFWRSNWWGGKHSNNDYDAGASWPNDRHDLLGFKMNDASGKVFSTGVDDTTLSNQLAGSGLTIEPNIFKAYTTNGVSGNPHGNNYLAMADKIDGFIDNRVLNDNVRRTVYDVIISNANPLNQQGLDLGTGITNFNQNATIEFFSGNGSVGALGDNTPDLLITQIAQPGAPDIYYYADIDGNVVGRPIRLNIADNYTTYPALFEWKLDLYRMDQTNPYDMAFPNGVSFGTKEHRPFRMGAFELEDFDINNSNIDQINTINMMAGGTADMAFIAYNKAAFQIKSPKVEDFPISRFVCRVPENSDPSTIDVTFSVSANVDGGPSYPEDPRDVITYQWFKDHTALTSASTTNTSYTLYGVKKADIDDDYRVRVSNGWGAVDIRIAIREGGVPTYWNGTTWQTPALYGDINDKDRNLIFTANYNKNVNLEACDCTVPAGYNVTIKSGKKVVLYGNLNVLPEFVVLDDQNNPVQTIPAGKFTLEDGASLVQIDKNAVNTGKIKVKRDADDLHTHDYVYWSSPVKDFNIANIPGPNNYKFVWDVNYDNGNGTKGNWVQASGNMVPGKGYIAMVPSANTFTNIFEGIPNNGDINIAVSRTNSNSMLLEDKHWNLIGNPYPSAINALDFLTLNAETNERIVGAVHLWTHGSQRSGSFDNPYYQNFDYNYNQDDYIAYNGTGSNPAGFNGYIASGQAFFVKTFSNNSTYTLNFTNEMRYDGSEHAYDNGQFYRANSTENTFDEAEKQLLWLGLINEAQVSTTALIGYVSGATNEKDILYDTQAMSTNFRLYSLIPNDDEKLSIQGRSLPFDGSDTVTLGFEVPTSGIYRIAIDQLKGSLFEENSQDIYLEDTYTGAIHDLRESPYAFTANEGITNDRFVLRYTAETMSVVDIASNDTFVFIKNDQLHVKSGNAIEAIQVHDINGKMIMAYTNNSRSNQLTTGFDFSKGVYLVNIKLQGNLNVTKKAIH